MERAKQDVDLQHYFFLASSFTLRHWASNPTRISHTVKPTVQCGRQQYSVAQRGDLLASTLLRHVLLFFTVRVPEAVRAAPQMNTTKYIYTYVNN